MAHYAAPLRDMRFVIEDWIGAPREWAEVAGFSMLDAETAAQVIEEAGRFAAEVLAPINANGDLEGCHYDEGRVTTPEGFRAAYAAFVEGGWPSLSCAEEHGGQNLPQLLDATLGEMIVSANHAWAMYPGLSHGAYECLRAHASDEIKAAYLPKIVSGEWLVSMCLTEPQAGSDLGLLRTRAETDGNGGYRISGSKIFISGGEHDLTDNIVHLVLARLPDAPAGTRGISLFLVPKRIPGTDGMQANALRCDGIEKKMGIKGSATCALSFDGATGWLIGEAHRGLAAMFVMMNSARLHVGLQGLGHAEAAYQRASVYASERRQMRAPESAVGEADEIRRHPAIRRVLLDLRSWTEGMRALGYWTAHLLDRAEHDSDPAQRDEAETLASLLTPVIKAFFSERGFELASDALQVFGGYGYVHEYGIEQIVRDSRIAMIYEGTNEIQAIDLLVRKIVADGGKRFRVLHDLLHAESIACIAEPACQRFGVELGALLGRLDAATSSLVVDAAADAELPYCCANDYLRLVGLVLLAFVWARSARVSAGRTEQAFYERKMASAKYFYDYALIEADIYLQRLDAARRGLPQVERSVAEL
jgi:alkylation response protein AidB-like acyl-CoA dehydrogenase